MNDNLPGLYGPQTPVRDSFLLSSGEDMQLSADIQGLLLRTMAREMAFEADSDSEPSSDRAPLTELLGSLSATLAATNDATNKLH